MVIPVSRQDLILGEISEPFLDSELILKLLKRTGRGLFYDKNVQRFYGDIHVALNEQSKSNDTVKALHPPFRLFRETLHPNKLYQWR